MSPSRAASRDASSISAFVFLAILLVVASEEPHGPGRAAVDEVDEGVDEEVQGIDGLERGEDGVAIVLGVAVGGEDEVVVVLGVFVCGVVTMWSFVFRS